jgi:hypothetical protein
MIKEGPFQITRSNHIFLMILSATVTTIFCLPLPQLAGKNIIWLPILIIIALSIMTYQVVKATWIIFVILLVLIVTSINLKENAEIISPLILGIFSYLVGIWIIFGIKTILPTKDKNPRIIINE